MVSVVQTCRVWRRWWSEGRVAAWAVVGALLLAVLAAGPAMAAPPNQVAIVLDTSGSMKTHDPAYRSHLAAQIFADMSGDADRLAILGMGQESTVSPMMQLAGARGEIKGRIKALVHRTGTRCVESLEAARAQLERAEGGQRFIVFLSDGECDRRSKDGGLTTEKLLAQLDEAGVRVYAIGLGDEVGEGTEARAYLTRLAEATRGEAFYVDRAEALPAIFATIFGRTRGSRSRTMTFRPGELTLEVEPYVETLTLVVTPEEGGKMDVGRVLEPGGEAAVGVTRASDTNRAGLPYLVLRVDRPRAGRWTIETTGDRRLHAAVIQTFDLRVTLDALPPAVPVGEAVTVVGRVEDGHGQPVSAEFARSIGFSLFVRGPGEASFRPAGELKAEGPGEFRGSFSADARGEYAVYGTAQRGETLDATTAAQRTTARGIKLRAELERPPRTDLAVGARVPLTVRLVGGDGEPIEPTVAEAAAVTLHVRSPGEGAFAPAQTLRHRDKGVFAGELKVDRRGEWEVYAVAEAGEDNRAQSQTWAVRVTSVVLEPGVEKLDLGMVRAGGEKEAVLDFAGSTLDRPEELALKARVSDDASTFAPQTFTLEPTRLQQRIVLRPAEDHEGGVFDGELLATPTDPALAGQGARFQVHYEVVPLSLWERWGGTILWVGGVLLGLVLLFAIVYGFVKPHDFSPHLRLFWGNTVDRFKRNQVQVVKLPGGRRGFYRNARFTLGGPDGALGQGGPVLVTVEAVGKDQVAMTASEGVTLERVNKFDYDDSQPVEEGEVVVSPGQIFKVGDLYFKLE